ncbi:hypothetical protein R1sor_000841 [Riccia sorocarpa]|uniref:Uncharacterized protein n=1 Tax=Riccia sorocarpa TaxID=122646 RepID=A0ABD3H0B9_9MARC
MKQLQPVVTSTEAVCAVVKAPEVQVVSAMNPISVVTEPENSQEAEPERGAPIQTPMELSSTAGPEVVNTMEEIVENPVEEARPDKGKQLAAEGGEPDGDPVEAGVYKREFNEEISELCTTGPALVQLQAQYDAMGDPLRPWEYMAAHAKAPSLHMNEVIRKPELDTNERTQSAESLRLLDPELRERWTEATGFTQNLVSSCTGVFGLMQELYSAYDLLSHSRKQIRDVLDELARCHHRFNSQFTRNIETGALLQIMYELLDKADPNGRFLGEYEKKVKEMRQQLDKDQEFWFRSRRPDMGHAELRRQFFADSGGSSDPRPTRDQGGSHEERGVSGPSSSNAGPTPPDSPEKTK